MRTQGKEPPGTAGSRRGIVSLFVLISAAVGFLLGLFEASLLWTTPRIIPLLQPDVGYVIWFLAPLVDMIFFAIVGLVVGSLASCTERKDLLVAVEVGVIVAFVFVMVVWFHVRFPLQPFRFSQEVTFPLICFLIGFGVSVPLLAVTWDRLAGFSGHWVRAFLKPLAWGLAGVSIIAAVGIGVFVARPVFSTTPAEAAPPPSGDPNIVFIVMDTVRADHLSAYGYSRATTPNLDRFARTGVLFENAISSTSWTLASHASMFTGLLPQQHGADWAVPLAPSPWTLAEILRSQGYETAGFVGNLLYLQKGWGIAQGFERYEDDSDSLRHNLIETLLGTGIIQPVYQRFCRFDYVGRENARQINELVSRWLLHRPQAPFFLFINYFDTHTPYVTKAPYNHRFGKVSSRLMRRFYRGLVGDKDATLLSGQDRESMIDAYDNCLAYLDNQVGNLLKFLRRSPRWQNTFVIVTSDHGEEFGGHGSYDHGRNLYRSVLHVPLIIAGPGVPRGLRIRHLVATRQLFSTVLDLAGGGKTPFSRYSLARFWNPSYKPSPPDNAVVSELVPINDLSAQRATMSLTTPEWQYIEHRSGRQELYHWTTDPDEKDNVAALPQEQANLNGLRSRLINLVSDATGPWLGKSYLRALDQVAGQSRLNLLFPRPLLPGAANTPFRIGIAQSYFKSRRSAATRPSQSEQDLLKSLPYQ